MRFRTASILVVGVAIAAAAVATAGDASRVASIVPLKEAKLNIEHNATDRDTGFQGFVDSEGWRRLEVRGPNGQVLALEGRGSLAKLGVTELFFETDEPENADVPISEMLAKLPEGRYTVTGPARRTVRRPAAPRGGRGSRTTSPQARNSSPPPPARPSRCGASSRAGVL